MSYHSTNSIAGSPVLVGTPGSSEISAFGTHYTSSRAGRNPTLTFADPPTMGLTSNHGQFPQIPESIFPIVTAETEKKSLPKTVNTVLSILRFEYVTFQHRFHPGHFNLNNSPISWDGMGSPHDLREHIENIGLGSDGAAKLLLILMWTSVLEGSGWHTYNGFWGHAREYAASKLFTFHNAPENIK